MKLSDFKLLNEERVFLSDEEKAAKNKKREQSAVAGAIAGLSTEEQKRLKQLMAKGAA